MMGVNPHQDFGIGCILISDPVLLEERDWVHIPSDWSGNIVQGKGYDFASGKGKRIWEECRIRAAASRPALFGDAIADAPLLAGGYGAPSLIRPLLSIVPAMLASARLAHVADPFAICYRFRRYRTLRQRSFRVAVLDTHRGRRLRTE